MFIYKAFQYDLYWNTNVSVSSPTAQTNTKEVSLSPPTPAELTWNSVPPPMYISERLAEIAPAGRQTEYRTKRHGCMARVDCFVTACKLHDLHTLYLFSRVSRRKYAVLRDVTNIEHAKTARRTEHGS